MGEQSISLSMPHIAEMTISAVINWENCENSRILYREAECNNKWYG